MQQRWPPEIGDLVALEAPCELRFDLKENIDILNFDVDVNQITNRGNVLYEDEVFFFFGFNPEKKMFAVFHIDRIIYIDNKDLWQSFRNVTII